MVSLLSSLGILGNDALYRLQVFWELIIYFKRSDILGATSLLMVSLPIFRYLGYGTLVSLQVLWELIKPSDVFEIIQGLSYSWFPFQT